MVLGIKQKSAKKDTIGETMKGLYCDNQNIIISSSSNVVVEDAIIFTKAGEVKGKIKATYDFSECPQELHSLGLMVLMRSRSNICLPIERQPIKRNLSTPEGRKIWADVERAAASAPEWAAKHIRKLFKRRGGRDR